MRESTAGAFISIFIIGSILFFLFLTHVLSKEVVYKQIELGEVRTYDKLYKCELIGHYVSEERFIPSTVTMEDLPKEIQDKLK